MMKYHLRYLYFLLLFISMNTFLIGQSEIHIAFWNVENLFDTVDDALKRDDDFTPEGAYHWTENRLLKKYHDLAKVINGINGNKSPDIIGLSEIENRDLLKELVHTYLEKKYRIIHQESPDERGIDCALLYDPKKVRCNRYLFHRVFLAKDDHTRDILEATFTPLNDPDAAPLYVFVNHWPSRWGGQAATDPKRRAAASVLRQRLNDILTQDPAADIVILGDFNDYPPDPSLFQILAAKPYSKNLLPGELINTTWDLHKETTTGTYVYKGEWVVLDQIIISQGMLDYEEYSWVSKSTKPYRPDFLIEQAGEHKGWPYRMYRGGEYLGGYSDHLPVSCTVIYNYP